MRIGPNAINAIASTISERHVEKLNLSDNLITDHGLHSLNNILTNNQGLKSINLASNMLSGENIELILPDLIQHPNL